MLLIAAGALTGVSHAQGRFPQVDHPLLKLVFESQKTAKFAGIRVIFFRD